MMFVPRHHQPGHIDAVGCLRHPRIAVEYRNRGREVLDLFAADAGDPAVLGLVGLGHRHCEGVLALTDDDDDNLAIVMTVTLLRPDLPVIARCHDRVVAERMRVFFESYDVLVLPVSQVPPFPADQEFPTSINGRPMDTYLDWMRAAYFITVTGCPAISVPFGTTASGLPVGVQLVAAHGRDRFLLEVAAAFEAAVAG